MSEISKHTMSKLSVLVSILLTFVVANEEKLDSNADNANQNIIAGFSVSELSVASDNFCNNHEKNVVVDVILLDNKMSHEKKMKKREAPLDSARREFKDRPRGDQKSLLIVFDGTGSMYDDLQQLRSGAQEIINDLSSSEHNPIFNYVLVVFRDPKVEAPFDTRNPDELLEKLTIINVNGGGDCSEMSISGLKIALEFALPNSLAYVFSDATAKDYAFYDEVVALIQKKQVQVNFLLTGDCDDQESAGYKVYQKISRVSNGQVYDMKKRDVKDVLLAIKNTVSHNYAALKSVDIEKAGTTKTDLNVDKSISELSVSISGKNPTLSIKSPENVTVISNDELTLPNLKLLNIKDPNDGVWRIEAGAESSHSLRLGAISDLKFEFGFSLNDVTKKTETSFQPLTGHKNILSIFVSNPSLIENLFNVTIITFPHNSAESSQKFSIPLKRVNDDIYATNSFEVPHQMFKIQLNGMDMHGNPIERLISTGLISSYGSEPDIEIEASQKELYEGERLYLKCFVKSQIPVRIIWSINNTQLKEIQSNQSNELEILIDNIKLEHQGFYKCSAVNGVGNKSKEMTISVLSTPQIKISLENSELIEDFEYVADCAIVNSYQGNYSFEWLLNDQKIAHSNNSTYKFKATSKHNQKNLKCRLITRDFTTEDSLFLNVKYAPKFLTRDDKSITLTYGENIKLKCNTDENPRASTILWFFTSTHSNVVKEIKNQNESILSVDSLYAEGDGVYECFVNNGIGIANRKFPIAIKPREPPRVVASNDVIITNETNDVELMCSCSNCMPVTDYSWKRDNHTNFRPSAEISGDSFKTILKLTNASEIDNGSFECQISNKLGSNKANIELLVQTQPKIESLILSHNGIDSEISSPTHLLEGGNVTVECVVDGYPESSIHWLKHNRKIAEDSLIELNKISLQDAGFYECVAENVIGRASKGFRLNINSPPKKADSIETVLHYEENSKVTINCQIKANPPPIISWKLNGKQLQDTRINFSHNNSIISFNAQNDDSGVYTCTGTNQFGQVEIDFTVVVMSAPILLSPNDEVINVRRGSSLKILCEATAFPQPQIEFSKANEVLSKSSPLELKNVSTSDSGKIHCIAKNSVGSAEKVFYITVVEIPKILPTSVSSNITLKANESLEIECRASGNPKPSIEWSLEDGSLLSSEEVLKLNSRSNTGKLTCKAENSEGVAKKHFYVEILNEPTLLPIVKDLQKVLSLRENDDMELICPFENFNAITWSHNHNSIESISHKLMEKKLIVYNINRSNNGVWTCFVLNEAGNASFSYEVHVLASPIIYPSWNLNERISDFLFTESDIDEKVLNVGESLKLNCTVDGIPKPKVEWRKSTDLIAEGEVLSIDNLQFHHSDIYTCSAENNQGATKKFFKIDIVSPPFVNDAPVQKEFLKTIGDSIILKCSSIVANPMPLYFWFKDNELLDDKTDDHLEIENLQVSDGGKYRCLAKNRYGSAKLDFNIDIYEPAKIINAEESPRNLRNDNSMRLSCTSRGNPLPIVSWLSNGHIITTTSKLNINKLLKTVQDNVIYFDGYGNGISYLDPFKIKLSKHKFYSQLTKLDNKMIKLEIIFKDRTKVSASKFNCYSFNGLGKDERAVDVIITHKPHVENVNAQKVHDYEILEHLPLLLSCLITAKPEPKITWFKNDRQIYENETVKFLNDNKFLSIEETFFWNSGNYSCVGVNSEGELELKFSVKVLSPPRLKDYTGENRFSNDKKIQIIKSSEREETIIIERGNDVSLECWTESFPTSKIHWVKLDFFDSKKREILSESENVLTLNNVEESATFLCYANNTIGSVQKYFFIKTQYPPKFIDNTRNEEQITVRLNHGFNFECRVKALPEPNVSWTLNSNVIEKSSEQFYLSTDKQVFRINNANKNHEGKIICSGANELGSIQRIFYLSVDIPLNIQYTAFSEWSTCSETCGNNGIQYRSRTCLLLNENPPYNCTGESIQKRRCNDIPCPINGGWSNWKKWSACPPCFNEELLERPTRKRYRTCDNPHPAYGGLHCNGPDVEEKECILVSCPIHGNWSAWTEWGACSKTCGRNSHRVRTRVCNNPTPKNNGRQCEGENVEYEECKLKACPNYNLRRASDRVRMDDSTERNGEVAELSIRNDAGEPRVFQFMQHREVEYFSPPPNNLMNGQKLPRIKVTLDTYKPISEETYKQHIKQVTSDELDDYFESSYDDSIELNPSTSIKSCTLGFKFNSEKNQCEEINECQYSELNKCRREEVCVNTIGSYRCVRK